MLKDAWLGVEGSSLSILFEPRLHSSVSNEPSSSQTDLHTTNIGQTALLIRSLLASYLTIYYKTFTDCSYDEIGILVMLIHLGGAILKPLICSYADRHGNYKECLTVAIGINTACTFGLALVPFYPQLLFDKPHPRLMWYLVSLDSFIGQVSLGVAVTVSDVFVIQECLQSPTGQHFGNYRLFGGLGWALSSILVAVVEPHVQLPYLSLPFLASGLFLLIDLPLLTQVKEIPRNVNLHSPSSRSSEKTDLVSGHSLVRQTISNQPDSARDLACQPRDELGCLEGAKKSTSPSKPSSDLSDPAVARCDKHQSREFDSAGTRRSDNRISFISQLDLLVCLSRHDHHHLVKYLIQFMLLGAFLQIHYIFYFQYYSEILGARHSTHLLFILGAIIQVSDFVAQSVSWCWIARLLVDKLDRDIVFLLTLLVSALRATIIGHLADKLNIWTLAVLELQTGLLYGISYTLMIECASSYVSIIDETLRFVTTFEEKEVNPKDLRGEELLAEKLKKLAETHSVEAISFAIRATIQGIFSGACEGIGFAIGPLLAGIWLSMRDNSLGTLYRDMVAAHLSVVLAIALLEFGLSRSLLKSRSRISRPEVAKATAPDKAGSFV